MVPPYSTYLGTALLVVLILVRTLRDRHCYHHRNGSEDGDDGDAHCGG